MKLAARGRLSCAESPGRWCEGPMHDASHVGIGIAVSGSSSGRRARPRAAPRPSTARRRTMGSRRQSPAGCGREPRRIPYQQPAERLVSGGAQARVSASTARQGLAKIVSRGTLRRHRFCGGGCRLLLQLLAKSGLAALSQGVVSLEVEDRAAQAGDELGKVDGFRVALRTAPCHSTTRVSNVSRDAHQLVLRARNCEAVCSLARCAPGPQLLPPQAHQLLRVVARLRLEEMFPVAWRAGLGVFPVAGARGDFLTRRGRLPSWSRLKRRVSPASRAAASASRMRA